MTLIVSIIGLVFAAAVLFAVLGFSGGHEAEGGMLIIIPLKKDTDNAEFLLRQALSLGECGRLVLLDMGADRETLEVCRRFSEDGVPLKIIPWDNDGERAAEIIRDMVTEHGSL